MIIVLPKPPPGQIRVRDSQSMKRVQSQIDGKVHGQTIPGFPESSFKRLMDENPSQAIQLVKVYRQSRGLTPPDDFPIDARVM